MNESTCENVIHEFEVMINNIGYYDKMNVNNPLNYSDGSDTCSYVQRLKEIVNTIRKNNVDDEVEDDIIPLEPITRKETLITSKTLHNF